MSRYQPRARSYPETLPLVEYADGVEVRRVDQNGWFSHRGREWKAGRAFVGQPAGLAPHRD